MKRGRKRLERKRIDGMRKNEETEEVRRGGRGAKYEWRKGRGECQRGRGEGRMRWEGEGEGRGRLEIVSG